MLDQKYLVPARCRALGEPFRWVIMAADMATLGLATGGASFDYSAQKWRHAHDHAHVTRDAAGNFSDRVMYCGADFGTCQR